jgi:2-polyprenyl-6-methoxyphenol hydroxylase-like FAD-dependent oxidoreductase
MSRARHAEIVGGGLAGLAMATALGQRGWSVRVHERASELRMFGAGIWIWENGLKSLGILGVADQAMARAKAISAFDIRDQDGQAMMQRPFADGDRMLLPPRADLYDALIAGATKYGADIVTDSPVRSATPEGEVVLEDGTTLRADLVIAADGAYSRLRESLFLTKKVDYLWEGYIRLLIPRLPEYSDSVISEYWNGSRRLLYCPCTDEFNYICLACSVDDVRARRVPVDKATWLESFPQHAAIIERFPEEARWDRAVNVTCRRWSSGRGVVIGDAAHGQPPNLGQAANMTFTNVVSLAAAVDSATDIPSALRSWEATERPLSDHVQRWSQLYGKIVGHWPENLSPQRTKFLQFATGLPWVQDQFNRAARHTPYGA